ncbi:MAG: hypothetical protein U5L02_05050 [Rheinheimera sp.]|nr:hypothetical protein [Rheinheimera sp.]
MMQAFEQGDAAKAHRVILQDAVVVGYSKKQQKVVNVSGAEWAKGFPRTSACLLLPATKVML